MASVPSGLPELPLALPEEVPHGALLFPGAVRSFSAVRPFIPRCNCSCGGSVEPVGPLPTRAPAASVPTSFCWSVFFIEKNPANDLFYVWILFGDSLKTRRDGVGGDGARDT